MKLSHIFLFSVLALSAIGCDRSAPAKAPATTAEAPVEAPAVAAPDTAITEVEEKAQVEKTVKPWQEVDVLGTALADLEGKVTLTDEQRQQLQNIAGQYQFQGTTEAEAQTLWRKLRQQVMKEVLTRQQIRQMRGA